MENNGVERLEYTRTTDVYQTPLEEGADREPSPGADCFISIHRSSIRGRIPVFRGRKSDL